VQVVEVVERIEEPVLESELPRVARVGGDVRVHGRGTSLGEPARPALVVAAGVEGIVREVEVVLEAIDEVLRGRADLHQVDGVRGPRNATVGSSKRSSTSVGS
jgi:hypothetical protein